MVVAAVLAGVAVSAAAAWRLMPAADAPALALVPPAVTAAPATAGAKPAAAVAPAAVPVAHADEQLALRELAALWGTTLAEGDACQAGLKQNLRCHQGKGGLYDLRLLNRPAIVTLREGASVGYAVLVSMDDNNVTLLMNGQTTTIPVAALASRFDGAFTTFWRMSRFYRDQIASGEQGPDVDWIAAKLAQLNGVKTPAENQPLDARMRELLRKFQTQQNLKADGVAGPRTYMRLNQLTGVAEPRLLIAKAGK
jgi:general secretion pathway protein A